MHPTFHPKGRPVSKANGMYVCAVISLAVCLLLTFVYWRWEVNSLISVNEQLRKELDTTRSDLSSKTTAAHSLEERANALKTEKETVDLELKNVKEEVYSFKEKKEKVEAQLSETKVQLEAATSEKQEIEAEKEKQKAEYQELLTKKDAELAEIQTQLDSALAQNAQYKLNNEQSKRTEAKTGAAAIVNNSTSPASNATDAGTTATNILPPLNTTTTNGEPDGVANVQNDLPVIYNPADLTKGLGGGEGTKIEGLNTLQEQKTDVVNPLNFSAPDLNDTEKTLNLTNPRTGDPGEMQKGMNTNSVVQEI